MNVPEWTKDEQSIDAAKNYLRQGATVDFFELMARSIIASHPPSLPEYALQVVNDVLEGKELPSDAEFHPKKLEDSAYMREMHVSDFLDEWVLALLRERPATDEDRLHFHKRYLEDLLHGTAATPAQNLPQ